MDALSNLVVSSLDWVWRASWQASVLAVIVLLLRWLLRRRIPTRWNHFLWYAVIARLALPVSLESTVSVFNLIHRNAPATIDLEEPIVDPLLPVDRSASTSDGSLTVGARADANPIMEARPEPPEVIYAKPPSWQGRLAALLPSPKPLMAWIWLSGILMLIGWTLRANHRLRRRLRSRPIVTDLRLLRILDECKRALGIRKDIRLVRSHKIPSPALYGLWNPILILPDRLSERFGEAAIRHVMLHELCHLRRRDIAANWLTTLLQAVHWFNPLVWLVMSRYRTDREMARDAEVVECLGVSHAAEYARTVIRLVSPGEDAKRPVPVPGLAGISDDGRLLRHRILDIFRTSRVQRASAGGWGAAFLVLILASLTDARVSVPSPEDESDAGLLLKVADGKSGDPIPSAEIRAGYYLTHTDGAGHAMIPLNKNLLVTIRAEGYVPDGFRISELDGCWLDGCTLKLYEGLTIGGMLRDETGVPVVGASIVAKILKDGANGRFDLGGLRTWSTASGQDGRWKCGSLPADFRDLVVRIRHPMFKDATLRAVSSAAAGKGAGAFPAVERKLLISGNATTVLGRGLPVRGLVLDAGGNPVAGARVWQEGAAEAGQPVSVLTSADGSFLLSNESEKAIKLTAEAPGYIHQTRIVGRGSQAGSLRFYLAKGYPLRGRVTDEKGLGIPGAQVRIESGELRRLLQSDALGRFFWDSAPARVALRAGARGFQSSEAIPVAVNGQEHQIRLSRIRQLTIEGRVLDSQMSQPVPRFRVVAGWTQSSRPVRSFLALGREGRFLLAVDEPALPGMQLSLRFEAPGYLPRHAVILPASEAGMTVKLTMAAAPAVSGMVVTPSGLPVAGARVCVLDRPSDFVSRAERDGGLAGKPETVSGFSGQFTLPLSAGRGHVVAFLPNLGIGEAPLQEFMRSRRITLQPWGAVEGVLRVGQSPGAEQSVILSSLLRDGTASVGWIQLTAEADVEGDFRFDRLPPGEYRLARLHGTAEGGSKQAGQFLTVAVRPGETTSVSLGGRGYRVTGRIVLVGSSGPIHWNRSRQSLDRVPELPEGSGPPDQSPGTDRKGLVLGTKQSDSLARLRQSYVIGFDPDGTFRIEDVLPGTYDLRIQTPDLLTITRRIVIPPLPSSRDTGELDLGSLTIR